MNSPLLGRALCRHHATALFGRCGAVSTAFSFVATSCQVRHHDDITLAFALPTIRRGSNKRGSSSIRCFVSNSHHPHKSSTYTKLPSSASSHTIPPSSDPQNIRVKIRPLGDGVTHVLLSRPSKLNSLDLSMFESIAEAASSLRRDRDCRVVVLSGEGRAFCTGLDAKSVALEGEAMRRLLERPSGYGGEGSGGGRGNLAQDVGYLWRQLPVPVIAVLHGMCFGGGMQIALGADFRFATKDCKLSIMESRWGLIPDMSASVTLRELVRSDVAKELAMTGRIISGEEGQRLGLVTRCAEDPMEEAIKVAKEIAERSPDSVAATKVMFNTTWVADEETCLKKETHLQMRLIKTYNQLAASGRQFGVSLPYFRRQEWDMR